LTVPACITWNVEWIRLPNRVLGVKLTFKDDFSMNGILLEVLLGQVKVSTVTSVVTVLVVYVKLNILMYLQVIEQKHEVCFEYH
jgi:hypothetical protein